MAVDSSITELEPQFINEFTKHQTETSKIMKRYTKKFISNKINMYLQTGGNIQKFKTMEENVLMSLAIGNIVNFARYDTADKSLYRSIFAKIKKDCKLNSETLCIKPGKIVMYGEIFMGSIDSRYLKLNMINNIPEHILQQIKKIYPQFSIYLD